jgi:hypothetical protein
MLAGRFAAALLTVALTILAAPGPAPAQNWIIQGWERYFRIESETGKDRRGNTVLSGYVYNTYAAYATNVRLLVETLDPAGQRTGQHAYPIYGTVPVDGRLYYEVKVPPAASYRVKVASWDWVRGGGSS